jgi:hypothetical protein
MIALEGEAPIRRAYLEGGLEFADVDDVKKLTTVCYSEPYENFHFGDQGNSCSLRRF